MTLKQSKVKPSDGRCFHRAWRQRHCKQGLRWIADTCLHHGFELCNESVAWLAGDAVKTAAEVCETSAPDLHLIRVFPLPRWHGAGGARLGEAAISLSQLSKGGVGVSIIWGLEMGNGGCFLSHVTGRLLESQSVALSSTSGYIEPGPSWPSNL